MSTLKDLERAQEEKYHRDQELSFKIFARRNKYFGIWIAEQLKLSPEASLEYAQKMVALNVEGNGDIIKQAMQDLLQDGLSMSETQLQKQLSVFFEQAKKELEA